MEKKKIQTWNKKVIAAPLKFNYGLSHLSSLSLITATPVFNQDII